MWSSNLELRMPIATGIFALDFFADAVAIKENPKQMFESLTLDDFYFSFGPGLRFSIPQFPIRMLLANTFKFNNGQFEWDKKWQFVLSFNLANR
jgi:outer membrane protein insertion porin family